MNDQTEARKRYTEKRIDKAKDYLGGVCRICGTTEELEFDHVDPATKVIAITTAIMKECWSWKRLVEELDKCQLLCHEHHVDKHRSRHPHGTAHRYWRGCRCQPCTTANTEWSRNYKQSHTSVAQHG